MEDDLKSILGKIVAAHMEKLYQEIAAKYNAIVLAQDAFSQKITDVVLSVLDKLEIEAIVTANKKHLLENCIKSLQIEDLFLALACARGDNAAWEIFLQRYKNYIFKIAHIFCNSSDSAVELAESVCGELFLPRLPDGPATDNKIATYNGKCSLQGWLKVVVSHAAVDAIRRKKPLIQLDGDSREQQTIAVTQPKSGQFAIHLDDTKHVHAVEQALQKSLKELPPKEKLLLDYYYYHGLSLKEIGVYFSVHEATISRWLDAIRKKIKKSVEKTLKAELGLKQAQLNELWTMAVEKVNIELKELIRE